jgi:hypothetical protein
MKVFHSFRLLLAAALLVILAVGAYGDEKAKSASFDALKKLAGDWVGTGSHGPGGHEVAVNYKVTSGGSAVVETMFGGTEHEMVTVYYRDGDDLVLTHYCMLQNQPHMRAAGGGAANKLVFKFDGGTNLKSEKDTHMHDMTLEIVDDDHIKSAWTMYKDGKPTETANFDMKRKK